MRIKYCLIFLFFVSFGKLFAQGDDPLFTFFPWGQSFYNPGAMGEKENHMNFVGILRQQSMGMRDTYADLENSQDPDIPNNNEQKDKKTKYPSQGGQQVLLNIDSYIKKIRGAVGITFLKDLNGNDEGFNNTGFRVGYATKFRVHRGKLGIGIQFGFLNTKAVVDRWNPNQPGDPTIALWNGEQSSIMNFDINFGLMYRTPTWYVGVSGTKLLGGVRVSGDADMLTKTPQQLYVSGGYIWELKTAVPWSIEPHVLIRTNLATWHLGVMALARYNGILWFGMGYQNIGIAALFGATPFYNQGNEYLKNLELGVAFTFPTTKFGYTSGGSWGDFELVVRYGFNFYKERTLSGYGSSRHLYKNQY